MSPDGEVDMASTTSAAEGALKAPVQTFVTFILAVIAFALMVVGNRAANRQLNEMTPWS
jgi:hypothetical protein